MEEAKGRMKRSGEGGQAGNTSMPWASGTNYNREVMPVKLCCSKSHTCTHTQKVFFVSTQANASHRSYTTDHE